MSTTTRHAAKQAAANASAASSSMLATEDECGPDAGPSKPVAMDAIAELQSTLEKAMREMAQVSSILQDVQADVSAVKATQAKMGTDVSMLFDRLEQADARIMDLERDNERLDKASREQTRQYEELRRTVQDMENRDRRVNVRLVGIKEQLENGKPRELVRTIISEALGIDLSETELQRVHRTSGPLPDEGKPPRPFVMRFHNYLEKERVLAAARQLSRGGEGILWNGSRISFFPDFTRDVVEKRKLFTDVRKKLHQLDVRFTLAYPAVLRFTWQKERLSFEDPRKAREFVNRL